jgi:hypothetical protein
MFQLRVQEEAQRQGLCLSDIQRETRLSMSTTRRYWYNSRTGLERDAGTLREVNLDVLGAIAAVLGVAHGALLVEGR